MSKKIKTPKVNTYKLLSECVNRGIGRGIDRSYKHTDTPSEEYIKEQIEHYVMLEISEYFDFDSK